MIHRDWKALPGQSSPSGILEGTVSEPTATPDFFHFYPSDVTMKSPLLRTPDSAPDCDVSMSPAMVPRGSFFARTPRPHATTLYHQLVTCQHYHALQFPDEKLQCCMDGKVTVADRVPVPNTDMLPGSLWLNFSSFTPPPMVQMAKTFERTSGASTICLALQACKSHHQTLEVARMSFVYVIPSCTE